MVGLRLVMVQASDMWKSFGVSQPHPVITLRIANTNHVIQLSFIPDKSKVRSACSSESCKISDIVRPVVRRFCARCGATYDPNGNLKALQLHNRSRTS